MTIEQRDVVVIGSGPAGQNAAMQAAQAGRRVLMIERAAGVGGACLHHGTIPSKTLRETASALSGFRRRTAGVYSIAVREDLQLGSLLARLDEVVRQHVRTVEEQLDRHCVERWHGRARFLSPQVIEVLGVDGSRRQVAGALIVIAVGSRPRTPGDVPVDHEHILDSDSILSLGYLPASLTVLGAGVIATEYASIFSSLGVVVTMIDRGERPVSFLDPELTGRFVAALERAGGRFLGGRSVARVAWDGLAAVVTTLEDGTQVASEKMLFALGRVANLDGLDVAAAGLAVERGLLTVDRHCRSAVPHIYAVGDVIGPPSLASSSIEQGRRAVRHALGLPAAAPPETTPLAVYGIPEMASVGLSEAQAIERTGYAVVGRARFDELARGQIAAIEGGLLKLVADASGRRLLGVQIVGEGAAELIHVGQIALLSDWDIDRFVDNIFNFPTLAEAYRVAALDVVDQRPQ